MFKPKVYIKDTSFDPIYKTVDAKFLLRTKIYPLGLTLIGVVLLGSQVILPLIQFKTQDTITKPVSSSILGIASGFRDFEFAELSTPQTAQADTHDLTFFYLTIPKLGIDNAVVEINSSSLDPDESLGHYKGSDLPGEVGNAFIYGHSALKWFYNPANYKTIFSTLDELDIGDLFYINIADRILKYKVESMEVLLPDQVNPLADVRPAFLNDSTVTLMTCVPPGTKLKRLLVVGVLDN